MSVAEEESVRTVLACLEGQREQLRGTPLALLWTELADELTSYVAGAGVVPLGVLG